MYIHCKSFAYFQLNYETSGLPQDTNATQSDGESPLDATEDVSGVHNHPSTTSTMNDASTFEPMQLSMEFDGEVSDANDAPASDLQNIYEGQVLSQSFAFQVGFKSVHQWIVNQALTYFYFFRKPKY